jgi:hypothetical protein
MGKFSELLKADNTKNDESAKPEKISTTDIKDGPSANVSISRSTKQSSKQSTGKVMDRPRGFYITERLNDRIDEAVKYFQDVHGIKKADRSVVVTAMLGREENWTEEALDNLVDRLMNELTSRLTG